MTERIEFGSKAAADSFREEHESYLCSEDDRRLLTVAISSSAPEWVLEDATIEAAAGRDERGSRGGQVDLTDHERESIDFSRTSVLHARSVKGIMLDRGVDDWLAYYDHTLSVDEHREVADRAVRDEHGDRLDDEQDVDGQLAAAEGARDEQCGQARDYCEDDEDDACEFLRDACDFDDDDIATLRETDDPDDVPTEIHAQLNQLWLQYQIGVGEAKEAAAAINEIHTETGRSLVEFRELGHRELTETNIDW